MSKQEVIGKLTPEEQFKLIIAKYSIDKVFRKNIDDTIALILKEKVNV